MFPELFRIPFLNYSVHSYGLMLVIGLLLGIELAKFLARRSGLNPDHFANAAILALVSGLIGARIAYVAQFPSDFTGGTVGQNVWTAINLTSGGLVYYGGFLLATPTLIVYAIVKRIPVLRGMDIIAPCLMIGLAFGRIGCFLNGCCWGQHCELPSPLAVRFPYFSPPYLDDYQNNRVTPPPALFQTDLVKHTSRLMTPEQIKAQKDLATTAAAERSLPVINTQLISTVTALLIAGVAFCFFTLGGTPGRGFALMLMLEGSSRFLIEGLRVEPSVLGPLTVSMLIGLGVALGGVTLWIAAGVAQKERPVASTPAVA
ncbi:MAG TPA: prolipoprotein diacylglyceryl transferase [Tepidisphaeraceae bacterium]|jgi:phosphatidylglycerol:prolipoprotein diacylglycerol transferase